MSNFLVFHQLSFQAKKQSRRKKMMKKFSSTLLRSQRSRSSVFRNFSRKSIFRKSFSTLPQTFENLKSLPERKKSYLADRKEELLSAGEDFLAYKKFKYSPRIQGLDKKYWKEYGLKYRSYIWVTGAIKVPKNSDILIPGYPGQKWS